MKFDYSAVEKFLEYKEGEIDIDEVMDHPAYKAIQHHAETFHHGLSTEDVERALKGEKTPFQGVQGFEERTDELLRFIDLLKEKEGKWINVITTELDQVIPRENKGGMVIYPVIGYDMGIGIDDCVCMNINSSLYLNDPHEFLYMAMHESSHALYERVHGYPKISDLDSVDSMISFFNTLLHTEGFGVYTPLNRRKADGSMGKSSHRCQEDYLIIMDEQRLKRHVYIYDSFRKELESAQDWTVDKFLNTAFGKDRFVYREGAAMVVGIEEIGGVMGLWDAFYMGSDEFVNKYDSILDKYR